MAAVGTNAMIVAGSSAKRFGFAAPLSPLASSGNEKQKLCLSHIHPAPSVVGTPGVGAAQVLLRRAAGRGNIAACPIIPACLRLRCGLLSLEARRHRRVGTRHDLMMFDA